MLLGYDACGMPYTSEVSLWTQAWNQSQNTPFTPKWCSSCSNALWFSSWDTFSRKTPRYFLPVQYSESTDAKLCRFVEHHSLPLGAYGLWIWPVTSADSLYAFCLKENKRRDLLVCPERWCCVLSLSTYQVPTQFTTGYLPSVRCQLFISNISPRSSLRYERYLKEVNLSA